MPPKVSVVVPVYNPGEHIKPLIESLQRQTLPPGEFEAIFVDDGSTDATPALLDRLAQEHPQFVVVHQPNSGWPGKPRNVGTDRATGDYVFYSDNDDWFGDEALERLHAAAVRENADIVIGKMVGHDRGVPRELFRKNRPHATFDNAPLQDSLTPHKLFRRAFLDEHEIRFPEGKRRLEDHVFVMRAFFAAREIYVLSDYDCYHHVGRPDESNAGYFSIEPVSYYGFVRETVDIVLANTGPGLIQDRLLRRFLRVEVLARLEGRRFTTVPPDRKRALFDAARALVTETMPTTVDAGLPGRQRLLAQMLRDGDLAAVEELASWGIGVGGRATMLAWADDALRLDWSVRAGRPGLLTREGDEWSLHPPLGRGARLDVTGDLPKAKVDLIAHDVDRGEVILPTKMSLDVAPDGRLVATGTSTIGVAGGASSLVAGLWTLRLRVRAFGWVADSPPLRLLRGAARPPAGLVGTPPTLVRATRTRRGAILVDVGGRARWLDADLALGTSFAARESRLEVVLPARRAGGDELSLRIGDRRVAAVAKSDGDETRVIADDALATGAMGPVRLDLAGRDPLPLGVDADAGPRLRRPARLVAQLRASQLKRSASWTLGSVTSFTNRTRAALRRALR